ncbi:hypothetical protein PDE_03037 [Penicillium oxalicum 114-2]|uniref:Uncharacterized protein n=1 Tax=Penicillium oxalicum (strain 114-2 / CGMCC 5302) TaxID=933388 RepID=S7ZHC8_PENO1|nr:hypothetical protein PDE_03037 [Penicillium oxalicum 114-2]
MPIPTRSVSLREPRKPSSSIARPATENKLTTKTTSIRPPALSANDTRLSQLGSPAESDSSNETAPSTRGRTFLPQRSHLTRDEGNGATQTQVRFQAPATTTRLLSRREETSPKRSGQQLTAVESDDTRRVPSTAITSGGAPGRHPSLRRPSALKTDAPKGNVPSLTKSTVPSLRPPSSPRKTSTLRLPTQSSTAGQRAASPKRTEMLPPPRPTRSASLKQPRDAAALTSSATVRGHARHRSQVAPVSTKSIGQPTPSTALAKTRAGLSTQQSSSPTKRLVKPPTPTPGSTSGPAAGLLIPTTWPDVASLQTELLQLSLFHSGSLQQQAEWKSAAESRLRQKYDAVASQYRSILVDEKNIQEQLNMRSLAHWLQNCHDGESKSPHHHQGLEGFSEQIQIFSQIVQEVSDLTASVPQGRYTQAVAVFEEWFDRANGISEQREHAHQGDPCSFIDPLHRGWKTSVRALQAELDLYARRMQTLHILSPADEEDLSQSALCRVARSITESIHLMTQEVRTMMALEDEMVLSEREYVRQWANASARSSKGTKAPRAGAWSHSAGDGPLLREGGGRG